MPSAEHIRRAVETYVDAFQSGDRERWLDNFAADAEHLDPPTEPAHVGRDEIGAFWDQTHGLVDHYVLDVKDVIVCGDEAVLSFTCNAYGPDGTGIAIDIVDVFGFDDDARIKRQKAYFDLTQARPLGS